MLTACIDNYHFWSNFTTGATISNGMEFGQGDGPRLLDNVNCDPTRNRTLLECDSMGASYASCRDHDAGVKCRDEQRVKNVAARIVNKLSTSTVYTVLVTWEQNLTVEEPTSFKVECSNEPQRKIITVSNKTLNTQLEGLLSSSYKCCVSAVYPPYEDKEICTGIDMTSNYSANILYVVIGILVLIIAVLMILLALSGIVLFRAESRKKLIPQRYVKL